MNKYVLLLALTPLVSFASEDCNGKVSYIMDHPSWCESHLAFKMDIIPEKWICSLSERSDSMILTALASDKVISARLALQIPGKCQAIGHYQKPEYISLLK
ncbi:hypothetical protein [Colwellia psychrerythraea]|uniref:Lipoprotein n=1 Tax=Colwellia psychrerythraea TaxID=28229 RepID=A0A099KEK1_COLPS|nr:hypothetical protein [Colwellia psychrerythraea]KGJ88796.1 hypothetical protein GAB14E_4199 [Colwellia psychrerythraea]